MAVPLYIRSLVNSHAQRVLVGEPVVRGLKQVRRGAESAALANGSGPGSLFSRNSLFRYAAPEVYVDVADMIAQPLVNGVYEFPGVRSFKTVFRITLLKPGQIFKEPRMGLLVFLCNRTTVFVHAPLLESKVAAAIKTEVVEHHRVDIAPQSFVQSSAKIFRHPEDHLVILVNAFNSGRVFVTPFHTCSPGLQYTRSRMITKTGVEPTAVPQKVVSWPWA